MFHNLSFRRSKMGCRVGPHCFQIFTCILVSITLVNGQFEQLNWAKNRKERALDYGTLLSSIETGAGAKEMLKAASKDLLIMPGKSDEATEAPTADKTTNDMLIVVGDDTDKVTRKEEAQSNQPVLIVVGHDADGASVDPQADADGHGITAPPSGPTDSFLSTKCTTDQAITVDPYDMMSNTDSDADVVTTDDPNDLPTEDINEEPSEDPNDEPTENPNKELTEDLDNIPVEFPTEDPKDITSNEIVPVTDEPEPPSTKVYFGPKKTHVPDHYIDDV